MHGILASYPHVRARLWYADAVRHGPWTLGDETAPTALPDPVGGGGTDFRPFFQRMEQDPLENMADTGFEALVYLSDGYGSFPGKTPDTPVLWIVPPGGLREECFPFGDVALLLQ